MSHTNPVHTLISSYFKFHFNSIIPSKSKSRKLSPSFRFLSQICVHLPLLYGSVSHLIPFNLISLIFSEVFALVVEDLRG